MSFDIQQGSERDLEKGLSPSPSFIPRNEPSPSPSARGSMPSLVFSTSNKALVISQSAKALATSNSAKALISSNSAKFLVGSNSGKALVVSNSGKRIDQIGKKKYVKQVTGKHNDTELHLAAQRGDLTGVKEILAEVVTQRMGSMSGAELDAEVAEIRSAVVNEVNELGETAMFTAAEKGHIDIVKELLQYSTREGISLKNRSGFDALHIAASKGHRDIVQVLLNHEPQLSQTVGNSNATPLISAATRGHLGVVVELLSIDSSLLEISKSNGKNALHLAARQGHVEIIKALLKKDTQLARRTDKKGQTALHMAVKGVSCEVVKALLDADAAIVMLPDKFGNTALHVATRKKRAENNSNANVKNRKAPARIEHHGGAMPFSYRVESRRQIVNELLRLPDTNVNALSRDHKTALDIAEGLAHSEQTSDIKDILARHGAVRANDLNQPRDELRKTVTEIKKDLHTQLEQTRKTNKNVDGIIKELRKLHSAGINNATNSATVVAVLFTTVAFAAIFTVPGGDDENGKAVMVGTRSFKIFFISNAIALFTSLAVVVVQITLVRGETKSERRVVEVINKLMWLASVCTTVAFISSSYIVVSRHHRWAAILVTVTGAVTMAGVLATMTYYEVKSKRIRTARKRQKITRTRKDSWRHSESSDSAVNPIYAI